MPPNLLAVALKSKRLDTISEVASLGLRFMEAYKPVYANFNQKFWGQDLSPLEAAIEQGAISWITRLGRNYRTASKRLSLLLRVPLPKKPSDRLALLDMARNVQALRSEFESQEPVAAVELGSEWQSYRTNLANVAKAADWAISISAASIRCSREGCLSLSAKKDQLAVLTTSLDEAIKNTWKGLKHISGALDLDVSAAFGVKRLEDIETSHLSQRANEWANSIETFDDWSRLMLADERVREVGLSDLADRLAQGQVKPEHAVGEVEYARAEALWKYSISKEPTLASLDGVRRSHLVNEFKTLEVKRKEYVAREISARHAAGLPRGGGAEIAVIRGEIARQRRHMPIRKLVERAGRALQKIKPVFLMSPLSVAQFLSPGAIIFDLLIIDEASQVRPEDALGAIARAKQIVIVGDKKQLPPTAFFDRLLSGIETDEDEASESPWCSKANRTRKHIVTL